MTKTNRDFKTLEGFIQGTNPYSEKVNEFTSYLDAAFHRGLKNLRNFTRRFRDVKLFADADSLLFEGRSLIFNRQTSRHIDGRDLLSGWQVLIAGGDFSSGGSVRIPKLGLRLRLLPGDMVMIRGRVLAHEIEPWKGGQRISLVNFTHESVWRYAERNLMEELGFSGSESSPFVGHILMREDLEVV